MISIPEFIGDLFNPDLAFLPKALVMTVVVAMVCGVVGAHVVLRGMAFIGDAVAHAVFPGLAVAFVLQGSLLIGGAVAGIITAILVALFSQNRRLKEDSIIGVFFVGAFALGIVIISQAPGYAGSLQSFLFGSITGITDSDMKIASIVGGILLLLMFLLHKEFVVVSLDREMAKSVGLPVLFLDLVLYVMVTIAIVISIQTIGNVLVLALLVTPAASARLLTDRIVAMMILGPVLGGGAALIGIYFSWTLDLPAGGTVVLVSTAMFFLTWVFAPKHGVIMRKLRTRSENAGFSDPSPVTA